MRSFKKVAGSPIYCVRIYVMLIACCACALLSFSYQGRLIINNYISTCGQNAAKAKNA